MHQPSGWGLLYLGAQPQNLQNQPLISDPAKAEKYGNEDLVIVFGLNQPFTLEIMARTFKEGDPSYAGPLAGVALGLKSYHILELKDEVPEELWDNEMGMAELELEDEVQAEIKGIMVEVRA